jgi:hypothetical protein
MGSMVGGALAAYEKALELRFGRRLKRPGRQECV